MSDKRKRLVRELQALRGCPYTEALEELRELPDDVSCRAYIILVRARLQAPAKGPTP